MATTSTFRRRRNRLGLNHYEALELIGSAYKDTKMIEWEYYNAADYNTNQKLAQRAQIVADALDEGLRAECKPSDFDMRENWPWPADIGNATDDCVDIRIGRELPDLEVWAQVRNGGVRYTSKDKRSIEAWVKADGGECVRFVPEGK